MHGYYNFDLKFNPDINFLIGVNGSGKTSALRLLQAALTIDIGVLSSISFKSLRLEVKENKTEYLLIIDNKTKYLKFQLNGVHSNILIPLPADDERSLYQGHGRFSEQMEEMRLRLLREEGGLFKDFVGIGRPLFLGLERRLGRYDNEFYDSLDGDDFSRTRRTRSASREIVEGIDNCQILVERAYVKFRRFADLRYSRLIKFIVVSLFDYIDFEPEKWGANQFSRNQLQALFNRRHELEKFATDLTGQSKHSQISNFFERVAKVLSLGAQQSEESLYVELLLNKVQLQRIFRILEEIDSQKKEAERHYEPIREWADALNKFFSQSGKKIDVDSVGKIKVTHNGVSIHLDNLSSGEKQLIILLTHARFSRSEGSAIIVDEPELSLHLHWQENLVDSLTHGRKANQFIFATHSPEIVGFRKDYCIRMG